MKKQNKYPISEFYVGELYLYTQFAGMTKGTYIPTGLEKIQSFSKSGAINFQQDMISRYIDWENTREYQGFLTIFYKQRDNYICLHDGVSYELNSPNIIENLIPITELLAKINSTNLSRINVQQALELFDTLFKESKDESILYAKEEQPISDFYVGDIALRERILSEDQDSRIQYFNLPQHIMLSKNGLEIYSFSQSNYINTVYRCLFLKDVVDLYNINNNQFYNPYEDHFRSIIDFKDYISEYKITPQLDSISIPNALRLFKKTLH